MQKKRSKKESIRNWVTKIKIRFTTFFAKTLESLTDWILKNWVKYILVKNLFYISVLPIAVVLAYVAGIAALAFLILFLVVLAFSFIFDELRVIIAEGDPESFIIGEKRERAFSTYSSIISISTLVYMYSAIPYILISVYSLHNRNTTLPTSYLGGLIVLFSLMFSALVPAMVNGVETSYFTELIRKNRPKWLIPEYFPSENIRACARFMVVVKLLPSSPRKKIMKRFSLFKEGIEIYNNHIKNKFGISLCEPERFFRYAKLKAFFTDEADDIKCSLEALIDLMKSKNEQPFEFIKLLKEMSNEPASNNEICRDIEMDTQPIRKWFVKHHEILTVLIAPLVISVITGIILYALKLY